jgi:hypothetical protein
VCSSDLAGMRGDPDEWTIEDLEAARARANDLVRRHGKRWLSALPLWKHRRRFRWFHRGRFRTILDQYLALFRKQHRGNRRHRARTRRMAIQRALVDLGYLEMRSGWMRARSMGPGTGPTYR